MIDNLTSEEINILKFINKNVYTDRAEAFRIFSLTSDYSLNHLLELDFLREIPSKNSDDLPWFTFTPKGQAFINNYEIIESQKEIEFQRLQKESLFSRKIAILSCCQHYFCNYANTIRIIIDAILKTIAASDI